jgi:G protein-coupled receptor 83
MAIIAIDRYQAINIRSYRRISNILPISMTITIIWLISCIFSTPELLFNKVVKLKLLDNTRCRAIYPEPRDITRQLLTLIIFVTQYVIPLMLTTILYVRIGLKIRRTSIYNKENGVLDRTDISDKKIIEMLSVVIIIFASCWLPLNLFHICADFSQDLVKFDSFLYYTCHMLAMSSVCYNPFLYFGLKKQFRCEIKTLFSSCFSKITQNLYNS